MSSNAYRLLGYVVWSGGKWYVHRRYRTARVLMRSGALAAGALGVAAAAARRAGD
jgi:hypothetical protein